MGCPNEKNDYKCNKKNREYSSKGITLNRIQHKNYYKDDLRRHALINISNYFLYNR